MSPLRDTWVGQKLATRYVWAEVKRNKTGCLIGLFTIFLVVSFISFLSSVVSRSPVIFLKIAENSAGETDILVTPGFGLDNIMSLYPPGIPLLNSTFMTSRLANVASVTGVSARWTLLASFSNPAWNLTVTPTPFPSVSPSSGIPVFPLPNLSPVHHPSAAIVLGIQSLKEKAIGLGRMWKFPPLGENQSYVSRTVMREVGLDPTVFGENVKIHMNLDMMDMARNFNSVNGTNESATAAGSSPAVMKLLVQNFLPQVAAVWDRQLNLAPLATVDIAGYLQPLGFLNRTGGGNSTRKVIVFGQEVTLNNPDQGFQAISDAVNTRLPGLNLNLSSLVQAGSTAAEVNARWNDLITNYDANTTVGDYIVGFAPNIQDQLIIDKEFSVMGVVDDPQGKWATALGSVVVLELDYLFKIITDQLILLLNINTTAPVGTFGVLDFGGHELELQVPGFATFDPLQAMGINFTVNESLNEGIANASQFVSQMKAEEYALIGNIQYRDRLIAYQQDLVQMRTSMVLFTNQVSVALGVDFPASYLLPIAQVLSGTIYIRYFLDNLFGSVVTVVVILGVMLIYALMNNDVEAKTYEYGMLRALGMRQANLIQVLVTKALTFSIPGICLGLIAGVIYLAPIASLLGGYTGTPTDSNLGGKAVATAVLIGLIMPLVANVVPISRALSRTLRDSLDVYHHVISDITIRITRLSDLGVVVWQVVLAFLMVLTGFMTFYILPRAFVYLDISMFLAVLNAILLAMLLGLCILAQILQPYVERVMLWPMVMLWHAKLRKIVEKNLAGHRGRNAKTAQMFTVCLAFVIFAGVMFALQERSLGDNVKTLVGADVMIQASSLSEFLAEDDMRAVMENELAKTRAGNGVVLAYTFVTYHLAQLDTVATVRLGNLPDFPNSKNHLYGVESNFLEATYSEYLMVDEQQPQDKKMTIDPISAITQYAGTLMLPTEQQGIRAPDPIGTGYITSDYNASVNPNEDTYRNYIDVLVSKSLRSSSSISITTPMLLSVTPMSRPQAAYYMCKPRAIITKMPGFFFSSFPSTASQSPVLTSMENFNRTMRATLTPTQPYPINAGGASGNGQPPKARLLLKFKPGTSLDDRTDVVNQLRPFFKSSKTVALDTLSLLDDVKVAVQILNLFFLVVGTVAMILCFFVLWLSFTANVRENAWEFGVLRAIGITKVEAVMLYIYEALALVLAAVLQGTVIGVVVAATLTIQFNLFTEMPFVMTFPSGLFGALVSMAFVVAILGSYFPAHGFMKKSIAHVIRKQ